MDPTFISVFLQFSIIKSKSGGGIKAELLSESNNSLKLLIFFFNLF